MPFANEHSARQQDPTKYVRFRLDEDKFAPGIHVVWGVTEDGTSELQSLRFLVSKWTVKDAKKWLEKHEHSATYFEEATSGSVGMCGTGMGFQTVSRKRKLGGVPTQKFRKELAKTGKYVHEGQEVELTHGALDHWVFQFSRMKKVGVKVPVAVGKHEKTIHPDNNRGWLVDLFREGDSLFMTCKIIGEDAIAMAPRSDVSLYAPPTWADGVGNDYVRPITHVLMVTDSVVPGLSDWIPLAASLSHRKEIDMDLVLLGKALGLSLKDAEKPEEMITTAHKKLRADIAERDGKLEAVGKEVEVLKLSLSEADGKKRPEPDPTMVGLVVDNRKLKLDGLSRAGRLLPTVREKMEKLFIGEGNGAIAMSLKSGVDDSFDAIVELFAANDPVELREQTGPQTLALSNSAAGGEKKNLVVEDAKRRGKEHRERFPVGVR